MLDTLHNATMRLATGALRFSPIPSILNTSNAMLLHIKRQEITMILAIKLSRNNTVSAVKSIYPTIQAIFDENNLNLKDIIT